MPVLTLAYPEGNEYTAGFPGSPPALASIRKTYELPGASTSGGIARLVDFVAKLAPYSRWAPFMRSTRPTYTRYHTGVPSMGGVHDTIGIAPTPVTPA